MSVSYRRSGVQDASLIRDFWIQHWAGDLIVAHGEIYHPEGLEGFIALDGNRWVGLVTYKILGGECEIVSLDSLREGEGVGSSLIGEVVREANKAGCARVFLITTNDNLEALGFYQKRGFELVRVNRGAVNRSRQVKPAIPLIGMHGIPLRDELELEMTLGGN